MKTITSIAACFLLVGCVANQETKSIKIIDPIVAIDAEIDSGLISLQPSLDGTIKIEQTIRFLQQRPTVSSRVVDGVLQLRGACSAGAVYCEVEYVVYAPSAVSVQAIAHSGDIEVRDLVGPLSLSATSGDITASGASQAVDLEVNSGDITAEDIQGAVTANAVSGDVALRRIIGEVNITVASGDISLNDLTGGATVSTNSGDISLSSISGDIDASVDSGDVTGVDLACDHFQASATSGDLTVTFIGPLQQFIAGLASGDIRVTLPSDAYQIDAQTSSGDTTITNVINDPNASRSLTVQTQSGDISLQGR